MSTRLAIILLIFCVAVISYVGTKMAVRADRTGPGKAFAGALFLGAASASSPSPCW